MNGTLNKVLLIGHLGDDVKMHYFEGGNCIGRFPLATNEVYINKQTNEKITSTEWHNLVVRNKAAEICEKYLSKGDKIFLNICKSEEISAPKDISEKDLLEIIEKQNQNDLENVAFQFRVPMSLGEPHTELDNCMIY